MIRAMAVIGVCLVASTLCGQHLARPVAGGEPRFLVRLNAYEVDADQLATIARDRDAQLREAAAAVESALSGHEQPAESRFSLEQLELLARRGVLRELGKAEVAAAAGQPVDYAQGVEVDARDPNVPARLSRQWLGLRGELTVTATEGNAPSLALACELTTETGKETVASRTVPALGRRQIHTNLQLPVGQPTVIGATSSTQTTVERRWWLGSRRREQKTTQFFVATAQPAR